VLLTRSPLEHCCSRSTCISLGTPPAFVLSQDQTLHEISFKRKCVWNHWLYDWSQNLCFPRLYAPLFYSEKTIKARHWRVLSLHPVKEPFPEGTDILSHTFPQVKEFFLNHSITPLKPVSLSSFTSEEADATASPMPTNSSSVSISCPVPYIHTPTPRQCQWMTRASWQPS
jgi:hypothetical protein